jgi:hypothetical protein
LNGVLVLDLNGVLAPNWVFTEATAINDAGQIVGVGRHNGQVRAFLLKPVLPALGNGIVPARASVPYRIRSNRTSTFGLANVAHALPGIAAH